MTSLEASKLEFNVDLDSIEPLNPKRTLAFINYWVYHTVQFLNQFSQICQERLLTLETKLRRASDVLSLLESKLSSIPGLEDVNENSIKPCETDTEKATGTQVPPKEDGDQDPAPAAPPEPSEPDIEAAPSDNKRLIPISSHPNFSSFFKMVNVGVPREAVKLKMAASGLDPALLDDPSAQVEDEQSGSGHSTPSSESWND